MTKKTITFTLDGQNKASNSFQNQNLLVRCTWCISSYLPVKLPATRSERKTPWFLACPKNIWAKFCLFFTQIFFSLKFPKSVFQQLLHLQKFTEVDMGNFENPDPKGQCFFFRGKVYTIYPSIRFLRKKTASKTEHDV